MAANALHWKFIGSLGLYTFPDMMFLDIAFPSPTLLANARGNTATKTQDITQVGVVSES
jgi:hypothetical protein